MNDARLQKKEERRWLKKAGFGKEMKDMGALAVELYGPASSDPGQGRTTPRLAAPKLRGSGAAKRTLTDLCREARVMRDECRSLRDECNKAVELVGYMRARMRRDCCRVAWLVGGLSLLNVAVVVVYMLLMGG